MKKLIEWFGLFLLLAVPCWPQAGAIASRRYAEKIPTAYTFGAYQAIYPYNEPNGFYAVPEAQFAAVPIDTNNFSSTANFTTYTVTGTQTFNVAGNVGTVASTSGSQSTVWYADTGTSYSFASPSIVSMVTLNQFGTSSTSNGGVSPGFVKDANDYLDAEFSWTAQTASVNIVIGGTQTTLCSANASNGTEFNTPSLTAPVTLALSLVGNLAAAWIDVGWGFQYLCEASTSSNYDFQTSGLAGWKTGFKVNIGSNDTWKVSALQGSVYGGVGIRDITPWTYADGRPYMEGSKLYEAGTVGGVSNQSGNPFGDSSSLMYTLDLSNGTFTPIGTIGVNRTGVFNDQNMDVVYSPLLGTEWEMAGRWPNGAVNVVTFIAKQTISTDDWRALGTHATPAAVSISLPFGTNNYDANFYCSAFNYSTNVCSLWPTAISNYNASPPSYPFLEQTVNDPTVNGFTQVFEDSTAAGYQQTRLLRTATTTGESGVTNTFCSTGGASINRCLNMAGTFLANLNATLPTNGGGSSMVSFGQNQYLTAYSGTGYSWIDQNSGYGPSSQGTGNLVVLTAPKYASSSAYVPMPVFSATGSTASYTRFVGSGTVSISDTLSGATICYTTDGSNPTANGAGQCVNGNTYSSALTISSATTLKAIASKSGYYDSWIQRTDYGLVLTPFEPLQGFSSGNSGDPNISIYVTSGVPYVTVCNSTSTVYGTTPTSSGGTTGSSNVNAYWAEWSTAGTYQISCSARGGQGIYMCPQCNGTVQGAFQGDPSGGITTYSLPISSTGRNFTLVCNSGGTITSITIAGQTPQIIATPNGNWNECYAAMFTSSYGSSNVSLTFSAAASPHVRALVFSY